MAIHRLPRNILRDIIEYTICEEYACLSTSVGLRLVNRVFNEEVSEALYERDTMDMLRKHTLGIWGVHPTGVALHKYIRGFLSRPVTSSDILNNIGKALRDGVLISSVLLEPETKTKNSKTIPNTHVSKAPTSTDDLSSQTPETWITTTTEETSEDSDEALPDHAVLPVCQAYVELLGDECAFKSLDPSWERDPAQFEILEGKTGHFWAFLAACISGKPDVITRAAKACTDHFGSEDESTVLKTHFAAGLLLMAKHGNVDAAKALLAHPEMRINLRLQNFRFMGKNAFEKAAEETQCEMIELFLSHGWNFTTVPMDYVKALRVTVIDMKPCPLRVKLLETLLEGDCRQWRSDAIVTGICNELCKKGDLETCKKLASLLKEPVTEKTEFRWVWDFNLNATNDIITGATANNNNHNDEDELDEMDFIAAELNTVLSHAVVNKHPEMIPWIWENKDNFPETMNYTFDPRTQIHCLELAIKKSEQETLLMLLKHNPEDLNIDKGRLFLLAVICGNLDAMTTLFPDIDLSLEFTETSSFWSWYDHTELSTTVLGLEDYRQPQSFLFSTSCPHRNCKLGTYALLCAIKTLQISAATFLLSKGCEIGTRLIAICPAFIEKSHARIFIPTKSAEDDGNDEDTPKKTPSQPFKLGKWVLMISLFRYSWVDMKHMLDQGGDFAAERTICLTKRSWWRLGRCKTTKLEEAKAKILIGIVVPSSTMHNRELGSEVMQTRLEEMQKLMAKHRMLLVYTGSADD